MRIPTRRLIPTLARLNLQVAVHRLRKRFRETLTEEVAGTVASPAQIEEEIGYMLQLMSR